MTRTALIACAAALLVAAISGCPRPAPDQTTPAPPMPLPNAVEPAPDDAPPAAAPENATTAASDDEAQPSAAADSGPVQVDKWASYKGAWFEVKYPASFQEIPCERSTSAEGYDGIVFASPDGKIEFYVFSPQWNGEPDWIIQADKESVVDKSEEKNGSKTTTWVTFSGPGGKYERSYADTVDAAQNTRTVFGFRYPNKAAYERWRPAYLKFKQSLQQYAD
jgi:hypothetical protein